MGASDFEIVAKHFSDETLKSLTEDFALHVAIMEEKIWMLNLELGRARECLDALVKESASRP